MSYGPDVTHVPDLQGVPSSLFSCDLSLRSLEDRPSGACPGKEQDPESKGYTGYYHNLLYW